ncbi:BTAD domain-containing putative transcriptional regulator [Nocardia sp. NBC_00511]|uniref:BTAD domain-containing putative transcriptional regulator n=1 Tax=Nocardia sp. NBC_00511 TaxID=2903591 RepID=UPI0030E2A6B0
MDDRAHGGHAAAQLRLTLLNGVEVHRAGELLPLGAPQRGAVLCALAFHRRRWVSAQSLLDALYDEEPPASGVAVIHTYVSALRRILEQDWVPRTPSALLQSGHGGYRLVIDDDQLDLGIFDRLVAEAVQAREAGAWERAQHCYERALQLYSGAALSGIPGPHAARQRDALTERRLAVLEDSLDVGIRMGRAEQVVDQLRVLIAEHPLRERPRGLLMRALHAGGRQSDALELYSKTRRVLVTELGVEPGPELRELHDGILSGDLEGVTYSETTKTPASHGTEYATLHDRERELARMLAAAKAAVASHGGMVVISGHPGYGKTALAQELIRRTPAMRCVLLEVSPSRADIRFSLAADIVSALGTPRTTGPAVNTAHEDRRAATQLTDVLTTLGEPVLVVIDDADKADPESLRLLIELAPQLRATRTLVVLTLDDRPWDAQQVEPHTALERAAGTVLRLGVLGPAAVAAAVARVTGKDCPDALAAQILDATAGVPRLVDALITDMATFPDPQGVPDYLPDGCYARALRRQLSRNSTPMRTTLHALAALDGSLPTVAELAAAIGEPESQTRHRCELLTTAGIFATSDPPAYRHGLAASTIQRQCEPDALSRMRVAAAARALVSGAGARRVATYLRDLTGTAWSRWVPVLLEAAEECLRRNAVSEAIGNLEIALRIAAATDRDQILIRLGRLEQLTNPIAAQSHLHEALSDQRARGVAPTALIPLVWTMVSRRHIDAATVLLNEVLAETEARDPATARTLHASTWMVAILAPETWAAFTRQLRSSDTPELDPIRRIVLATADANVVCRSARETFELFPREWHDDRTWHGLPREMVGGIAQLALWAGDNELVWQLSTEADDRHFGAVDVYRRIFRTAVLRRRGQYREALRESGIEIESPPGATAGSPAALISQYSQCLLGLGRVEEAERWLDHAVHNANPQTWEWLMVQNVRGLISSARGDAATAAAHFLDCGRRAAAWGGVNPGSIPWRSSAAMELARIGDYERAMPLAHTELELAQRWDTPATLGRAWRAVALASPEHDRVRLLHKAVEFLSQSDARDELLPALIDQAAACSRAGDRQRAEDVRVRAQALADACGAHLGPALV